MIPSNSVRIFLATKTVDVRKGMDALVAYVANDVELDPCDGAVWIFRSRRADRLKLVVRDGSGLVLVAKRLNGKSFVWPKPQSGPTTLTKVQFEALFSGIEWRNLRSPVTRKPVFVWGPDLGGMGRADVGLTSGAAPIQAVLMRSILHIRRIRAD